MKISDDMFKAKVLDFLSGINRELKRFNDREEKNLTVIIKEENTDEIRLDEDGN